jgi:polysaccharide lyase-like protein
MHARAKACAAISLVTFVAGATSGFAAHPHAQLAVRAPRATSHTGGGTVLFRSNWRDGIAPWNWGAQCKPWMSDSNRGGISISGPIARFFLAGGENACEVLRKRTVNLGSDEYYALRIRFPKDWVEPGPWGAAVAQFNYAALGGPPVGLFAHALRMDVVVLAGEVRWPGCNGPAQGCQDREQYNNTNGRGRGGTAIPIGMRLGVWHELVVHVHWATDSSGMVDVWHKIQGARRWDHTYHVSGVPTMQWAPCCLRADGKDADGTTGFTSDKIGVYRLPNGKAVSLWNGGFAVASSFDAAVGALR